MNQKHTSLLLFRKCVARACAMAEKIQSSNFIVKVINLNNLNHFWVLA